MSEFGIRTPEALAQAVRDKVNEREAIHRYAFLHDTMFHEAHHEETLNGLSAEDDLLAYHEALNSFQLEFLNEKQDLDMTERFRLALNDKYLGKIHVVELGYTTEPGASGEADGLKGEYRKLLAWLVDNGFIDDELSRSCSGRSVRVRHPELDEAKGRVMIVARNRPLIKTTLELDDRSVDIRVAKRMVFSLPTQAVRGLLRDDTLPVSEQLNSEYSLSMIETMLEHKSGGIEPIRTAYYLATNVRYASDATRDAE